MATISLIIDIYRDDRAISLNHGKIQAIFAVRKRSGHRPRFFPMLRPEDAFKRERWAAAGVGWNVGTVKSLFVLTTFVTVMAVLLVPGERKPPGP